MIAPDSSVLIPALASTYEAHARSVAALAGRSPRLIAHVAFETTSVLSRMPEGLRMTPASVRDALDLDFPDPWLALDAEGQRACLSRAVDAGLHGGSLYDALIAATAREHGATLLSADRRARDAYDAIGVEVSYLEYFHPAHAPGGGAACGSADRRACAPVERAHRSTPIARRSARSRRA